MKSIDNKKIGYILVKYTQFLFVTPQGLLSVMFVRYG